MTEDLFLVGYRAGAAVQLGLEIDGIIYGLADTIPSLDHLLQSVPAGELIPKLLAAKGEPVQPALDSLCFPANLQEVWAAGVTYKLSEEARERESKNSTIYARVYGADRPELFFKAMGYQVVNNGQPVGIRYDAHWSVPEPELTVVLNARLEVVGFTIGNDMSSRDIEGENPLYLPQAKMYEAACALGPRLWLQPGLNSWPDLTIEIEIRRNNDAIFYGQTSTANIHRPLPALVDYLGRCRRFPAGLFLLSGTGIVPPDEFTLQTADQITISIEPIGQLTNPVKVVGRLA